MRQPKNGLSAGLAAALTAAAVLGAVTVAGCAGTQSKAPSAGISAIEGITDQATLADVAINDKDENVRKAAFEKLTDENALLRVALETASCQDIKEFTRQKLMAYFLTDVKMLAVRKLQNQQSLGRVALEARCPEVQYQAMTELKDEAVLGQVAAESKDWRIGESAAEKITDRAILLKVMRQNRDRRVFKAAAFALVARVIADGNWSDALKIAEASDKDFPGNPEGLFVADVARDVLDHQRDALRSEYDAPYNDDEAMKTLSAWAEPLLERYPDNPNVLILSGWLYSPKGTADVTLFTQKFEHARDLAPKSAYIMRCLGSAYGAAGKLDDAIDTLIRSISLNPSSSAYANLGLAYMNKGMDQQAQAAFDNAVTTDSRDPMAWFNLASFHLQKGRPAMAEPPLKKAVELAPRNMEIRWNLGGLYYKSGRRQEAAEQLKAMINIAPDSAAAQRAREMLAEL